MSLVKICGVKSVEAALVCAQAGGDFLGLNFHPPSVRFIDTVLAAAIVQSLPAGCTPVGLFVNRPTNLVKEITRETGLTWVQLHGDEHRSEIQALQESGLSVIRAYKLGTEDDVQQMEADLKAMASEGIVPNAVLVDAKGQPGVHGGTGKTIPEELLRRLAQLTFWESTPGSLHNTRLILAGGLNPENVLAQVQIAGVNVVWMVDTASGVESTPGEKDPQKVMAFVKAVRTR